ncbi:MAG: NUDIX domain-containing protein [Dehalococcoidales bacterium]|nr:NUDIX domain-containing protein [Dehalococcoidales bacterium]
MAEPVLFDPHLDVNFRNEYGHFRMRVAAIIIEDGYLLTATSERDPYHYFIGGAAHVCEHLEDAVKREAMEETGVSYEVDRLVMVTERIFPKKRMNGQMEDFHEVCFYFLMKPRGKRDAETQPVPPGCLIENINWTRLEDVKDIDLRPKYLADMITDLPKEIVHVVLS